MTQTTVTNMTTAAFLTKAITAIITTITAAAGAAARGPEAPGNRSIGLIPPQYMPALAQSHILRLRVLQAATACPRCPPGNRTQEQGIPNGSRAKGAGIKVG